MERIIIEKKAYASPSVSVIGSISEFTKTGDWWKKRTGPGDQYFMTDPPSCWDGDWYNNCQDASA